jgi:hypothetical protein
LQAIDGSNNQFTGSLPHVTSSVLLDIRGNNNQLSGSLDAATLGSLTLQTFEFANNSLSGAVPPISSSIKVLNIGGNNLGCFAPMAVGTDLIITGNKFLCTTGVTRVPGCVIPSIATLIAPTSSVMLNSGGVTFTAQFTLSDPDPLRGCSNLYCFLGSSQMGGVSGPDASGTFTCKITPLSVGAYSLSVRTSDGTTVTQQQNGMAILITVTAGCAGPNNMCNTPQGTCTPNGCVCDQSKGWQGNDCNAKICPRNCFQSATPAQGTCNTATGVCACNAGWGGADCSVAQMMCPGPQSPPCSGRGSCVLSTGQCQCYPQVMLDNLPSNVPARNFTFRYTGTYCQTFVCPTLMLPDGTMTVCSNHGMCTDTQCNCNQGFAGADCSVGTLSCPSPCPANISSCDMTVGQCACTRGLTGPLCDQHVCPTTVAGVDCSGHGTCDSTTGICNCDPQYNVLGSCSVMAIPCPMQPAGGPGNLSAPCGGPQFGECKLTTGVCQCINNARAAYTGTACETPICPSAWKDCNPNGLSPASGMCVNAACVCSSGYSGQTCSSKNCVLGDDGSQCNVMSGKGECDGGSGFCQCLMTGAALDPKTGCASLLCPSSNNAVDCAGNGVCKNGVCSCNSGWGGSGCSTPVQNPLPVSAGRAVRLIACASQIALGVVGAILYVCSCAVLVFFILRRRAINKLTQH